MKLLYLESGGVLQGHGSILANGHVTNVRPEQMVCAHHGKMHVYHSTLKILRQPAFTTLMNKIESNIPFPILSLRLHMCNVVIQHVKHPHKYLSGIYDYFYPEYVDWRE